MPAPDALCENSSCRDESVFFFFQAEDGIRDLTVTGVQTCALPISYGRWPDLAPLEQHEHRPRRISSNASFAGVGHCVRDLRLPACDFAKLCHGERRDRKSTRLNSSHSQISYAVFCLKKKKQRNLPVSSASHHLSTFMHSTAPSP